MGFKKKAKKHIDKVGKLSVSDCFIVNRQERLKLILCSVI